MEVCIVRIILEMLSQRQNSIAPVLKKISGGQVGGFLILQSKINQLIAYKHLLSTKQKQGILNALQTG